MPDMAATAEQIYTFLKDKKEWPWNKPEENSSRKIKEPVSKR